MPFSLIGIERYGESTSLKIHFRSFRRTLPEEKLTHRTDLVDIHYDHRTRTRVPFLWRDELSVFLRSKLVNGSWRTGSTYCALAWMTVTFPEEAYYPWGTVECAKHDSDSTILAYMRDCLDS